MQLLHCGCSAVIVCHDTYSSHLSISRSLFAVPPPDAYRETLWVENGCTHRGCFQSFGRETELLSYPLAQSSYRNSDMFSLNLPIFLFSRNSVCSELFTNEANLQGNCNHISHCFFFPLQQQRSHWYTREVSAPLTYGKYSA